MQSKWGTHGDHPAIVLSPSTIREVFDTTVKCFNFAERMRTVTFLAMDEIIAHLREKIVIPPASEIQVENRKRPALEPGQPYNPYEPDEDLVPPMFNYGEGFRYHVTGLDHDKTGFPSGSPEVMESLHRRLVDKVEKNRDSLILDEKVHLDDVEVLVVAYGSTARSARRAVEEARAKGVKAGLYRPITLFPLPEKQIRQAAARAKRVVVPEMNLGQYRLEVERVLGKPVTGVHRVNGEPILPSLILSAILGD
jgi:2-oxoglutarate ferredoxin oxidoreductase subunit alpha